VPREEENSVPGSPEDTQPLADRAEAAGCPAHPSRLAIILVNWNTADLLVQCLESVRSSAAGREAQIVVVDNASEDDSVTRLRERFPDVEVIENTRNVGFAKANNEGAARCSADLLVLLNTDTIVSPDSLKRMAEFMDENPEVGILGPRLLGSDGLPQSSCRTEPSALSAFLEATLLGRLFRRSRFFGRAEMTWFDHRSTIDADYVSGACLMIRRALWEELGGFDGSFFFYGEDADLCRRARKTGARVVFYGDAEITHLGGGSAQRVGPKAAVEGYRSAFLFVRKHRGRGSVAAGCGETEDLRGRLANAALRAHLPRPG